MATTAQPPSTWRSIMNTGNSHFRRGKNCGREACDLEGCMKEALQCYNSALRQARTPLERSSTFKNISMASGAIASCESISAVSRLHFLGEALKACSQSCHSGQQHHDAAWTDDLISRIVSICDEVLADRCSLKTTGLTLVSVLWDATNAVGYHPIVRTVTAMTLFSMGNRIGAIANSEREYHRGAAAIAEFGSLVPLTEGWCERHPEVLSTEAKTRVQDMRNTEAFSRAMILLQRGLRLTEQAVETAIDMDITMDALDAFRSAIQATENDHLVLEAECRSHIGRILDTILKLRNQAHTAYRDAINKAYACTQHDFRSHPWHRRAINFLEKYQTEERRRQEQETEEMMAPIRANCEERLTLLKAAHAKGCREFLKFLVETYKPDAVPTFTSYNTSKGTDATDTNTAEDQDDEDVKKYYHRMVLKVSIAFHPDRCSTKTTETKYLFGEISKLLNHFVNTSKGC